MGVPLEERSIVTSEPGKKEERHPALDSRWKRDIGFLTYSAPPDAKSDQATIEEWQERATFLADDLDMLLRMPHDKFWCQVVYDNSLALCVDFYLKLAPRPHDTKLSMSPNVEEKQQQLHRLFFFTCLRMATHKESKETFITPSVFGDIIYQNFIFDIPKIMDICTLYGESNHALLEKMIGNIFTQQPAYIDDLRATVPTFIEVFTSVAKKCGLQLGSNSASPRKITGNAVPNKNLLVSMTAENFEDVLMYVSDAAHSLHAFLEVHPAGAEVLTQDEFSMILVTFFECMTPAVTEAFKLRDWQDLNRKLQLKLIWMKSQVLLAKIYRQIIEVNCLKPLLEKDVEAEEVVEFYINMTTAILGERRFVAVYNHLYPFKDDKDLIMQSKCNIDETRLQFLQDGINEAVALYGKKKQDLAEPQPRKEETESKALRQPEFLTDMTIIAASRDKDATYGVNNAGAAKNEELGACAKTITGIELESLITSVKDLLPDLGEGFIELCLEELDYNVENVINAVLEEKLPESLDGIERDLKRDKSKIKIEEPSLIDQRLSVFDNDEFDVFRRDGVDKQRVHKGKKTKITADDLQDKELVASLKPLYDKYGGEFTESAYDVTTEYDDEYDDTYDAHEVGADDADSADELNTGRPFTVPRVLDLRNSGNRGQGTSGSDASGGDSEEERQKPRDEFVQNPADIRAKREAQRAVRGGGGRRHDVKGRDKGQGQEKDVVRNRAFKERNKNKNRRAQADKKRAV